MTLISSIRPWCRKQPLLLGSAAAALGILGAEATGLVPAFWLFACLAMLWLLAIWRRNLWQTLPAVACTFAIVHSLRLADTFTHPIHEFLESRADRPAEAEIRGRLYPWNDGAELDPAQALCEVHEIRWGHLGYKPEAVSCQIRVRLPMGVALDRPGTYAIRGALTAPTAAKNPGQFDAATYSLRMGWVAQMQARTVLWQEEDPRAFRFHALQMAESCRQWIIHQLGRGIEDGGETAGVILAMALGASDAAGHEIEDAFRDSGTLHVFAVSGLHVVMLAGIAGSCLFWVGKQRLSLLLILLVFAYAFMTGWRPSAARAAFMTSFLLAAPLFNRQTQAPNILGAAALLLLLGDSHQLFLPGFQLSFAVLLVILLAASGLTDKARRWWDLDPFLPPVLASRWQRFWARRRKAAASLVCVSAVAWVGSLPFMLGHFSTVTPVAVLSNLLLVPASGFCLVLSCMSLSLAACQWGAAVVLVNQINLWLAKGMVFLAGWFAALPYANHPLDLRQETRPPAEIQVFSVPYGGAASYLRSDDRHWLLDTGNERTWRGIVRPFLRQAGIHHLDGLVLTHADISHAGAVPLLLKSHHPQHLFTSVLEPWPQDPPFASLKKLARTLPPDGDLWKRGGAGEILELIEGTRLPVRTEVLYPGPQDLHEKADDRGMVLRMQVGRHVLLWLGDAGFVTEKRLLEARAAVRCDILIRNQHSADASGLEEFLTAARPQAIISSSDAWQVEERLPERIRAYCDRLAIPLFDLTQSGCVGIRFEENEARLRGFYNGQETVIRPGL